MFVRSNGMVGIKRRTRYIWMQECGYDESEAIILAKYQTRANLSALAGCILLFAIAANVTRH
jgi:hypothetical protein